MICCTILQNIFKDTPKNCLWSPQLGAPLNRIFSEDTNHKKKFAPIPFGHGQLLQKTRSLKMQMFLAEVAKLLLTLCHQSAYTWRANIRSTTGGVSACGRSLRKCCVCVLGVSALRKLEFAVAEFLASGQLSDWT